MYYRVAHCNVALYFFTIMEPPLLLHAIFFLSVFDSGDYFLEFVYKFSPGFFEYENFCFASELCLQSSHACGS